MIYGDSSANKAYVVRGASSFPGTTTTLSRTGSSSFGYDVSGGGDINGDGYDDVIVGNPGYSANTGRLVVYYGSSTGVSTASYAVLPAPVSGTGFASTVLVIGDINGDGYDDVAVADDYNYNNVYVYHGSASGLVSTPVNTLVGADSNFGDSMSSGDVNKDGYRDLVIGYLATAAYIYAGCPDTDRDGYCTDRDCNDNSAAINPAATETCDSIDNDCDCLIDDADTGVSGRSTFYRDSDGDTYGRSTSTSACSAPSGYVTNSTDCNNASAAINPAATETCDRVNNDCDGLTDDSDPGVTGRSTFYRDSDGDTYGTSATTSVSCFQPTGYVSNSSDCNDASSAIRPSVTEICDSTDNDCDGLTDDADPGITGQINFYRDNDGDTYSGASTTTACVQPSGYATVTIRTPPSIPASPKSAAVATKTVMAWWTTRTRRWTPVPATPFSATRMGTAKARNPRPSSPVCFRTEPSNRDRIATTATRTCMPARQKWRTARTTTATGWSTTAIKPASAGVRRRVASAMLHCG